MLNNKFSKLPTSQLMLIFSVLIIATGCTGPSNEEKTLVSSACEDFITKEMGGEYKIETHIFDVYKKKGNLVAEVGYRDKYKSEDSYSVRLCVVDQEKGYISSPSPLNDTEWAK